MRVTILLVLIAAVISAQAPALTIGFTPESPKFEAGASEYTELWAREGERIVNAMQSVSGLKFDGNQVRAIVFEGTSESGYRERPMRLRASYPSDTKKAMNSATGYSPASCPEARTTIRTSSCGFTTFG